jgi:hypothetical protein
MTDPSLGDLALWGHRKTVINPETGNEEKVWTGHVAVVVEIAQDYLKIAHKAARTAAESSVSRARTSRMAWIGYALMIRTSWGSGRR